jgi:hypothetical protein
VPERNITLQEKIVAPKELQGELVLIFHLVVFGACMSEGILKLGGSFDRGLSANYLTYALSGSLFLKPADTGIFAPSRSPCRHSSEDES